MQQPFYRRAPVRRPWFSWIALLTLTGVPAGLAAEEASVRPPDAAPDQPAREAASLDLFGTSVRENVFRPGAFYAADLSRGTAGGTVPGGLSMDHGGFSVEPANGLQPRGLDWDALLGLAGAIRSATAPALANPVVSLPESPRPSAVRFGRATTRAVPASDPVSTGRSGDWPGLARAVAPAGSPAAFAVHTPAPAPSTGGWLPLGSPAGLLSLPRTVLPGPVTHATARTATSTGNGNWQNPAIWSIDPAGGPGFPNNTADDTYAVLINANRSFDLGADVTISSLELSSGMTFQNAANRTFTVHGAFNSISGTLVTASSVTLVLNGNTVFNSRLDLRNGARLINNGTLSVGALGAGFHEQDVVFPVNTSYSMENSGQMIIDRDGTTEFQNWSLLNSGVVDVRQGTLRAENFTQVDGGAVFRIRSGAFLRANRLGFNGGVVIASGSTLEGSSFSFANSTLLIGETLDDIANLTLAGNAAGDAGQGATFRFLFAGAGAGQFDTLTIQNGMNFDGLTLDIETLNGFEPAGTDVFRIITGNNLSNGNFANVTGGVLDVPGLGTFNVTRNNSFVELSSFVPIPEPSLPALLAAGAAVLGLRRRKSR